MPCRAKGQVYTNPCGGDSFANTTSWGDILLSLPVVKWYTYQNSNVLVVDVGMS